MSHPKDPERYPEEFSRLFSLVMEQGEVVIPCASTAEAEALRFRLYGFRNALTENPKGFEEIAWVSQGYRFYVTVEGCAHPALKIVDGALDQEVELIKAILGDSNVDTTPDQSDSNEASS